MSVVIVYLAYLIGIVLYHSNHDEMKYKHYFRAAMLIMLGITILYNMWTNLWYIFALILLLWRNHALIMLALGFFMLNPLVNLPLCILTSTLLGTCKRLETKKKQILLRQVMYNLVIFVPALILWAKPF